MVNFVWISRGQNFVFSRFKWTRFSRGQKNSKDKIFVCGSIVREGQILEAQTDVKEFQ